MATLAATISGYQADAEAAAIAFLVISVVLSVVALVRRKL